MVSKIDQVVLLERGHLSLTIQFNFFVIDLEIDMIYLKKDFVTDIY